MLLTFTDLVSFPLPLCLREIHLLFILFHRRKGDSTMEDIWRYMRPLSYILYFPPHIWPSRFDDTNSTFLRLPIMNPFLSCPCSSCFLSQLILSALISLYADLLLVFCSPSLMAFTFSIVYLTPLLPFWPWDWGCKGTMATQAVQCKRFLTMSSK